MAIGLQTSLKQTQKLAMTQNIKLSLEMLQMNSIELSQLIQNELESNPVLEEEPRSEKEADEDLALILSTGVEYNEDIFDDDSDYSGNDRKQQFLESVTSSKISLYEHFVNQIKLLDLDRKESLILERIAGSVNSDGLLSVARDVVISESGLGVKRCMDLFDIFYRLDPPGCGAVSVQETLLVQSRIHYPDEIKLHEMLEKHFELLKSLLWDKLSDSLCVSISELKHLSSLLSRLDPYPGRMYSGEPAEKIVPEAKVVLINGEVIIQYYDGNIPALKINSYYLNVLRKKNIDAKIRKFIREGVDSARGLMKNIFDRRVTFEKVLRSIMNHQTDFLAQGGTNLKPLTYQIIAEETNFHESTVSRTVSGKYIETEWGVLPVKYFFSNRSFGGESSSSDEIKRIINDIVAAENKDEPLSDEDIVRMLSKSGYEVARRTIAKYRSILEIPSSDKRKRINMIKKKEAL